MEFRHTLYDKNTSPGKSLTFGCTKIIKRHDIQRHTEVNEWLQTYLNRAQQGHLSGSAHGSFSVREKDAHTHRTGERVWTYSRDRRHSGK